MGEGGWVQQSPANTTKSAAARLLSPAALPHCLVAVHRRGDGRGQGKARARASGTSSCQSSPLVTPSLPCFMALATSLVSPPPHLLHSAVLVSASTNHFTVNFRLSSLSSGSSLHLTPSDSMRTAVCLIVLIALMASIARGNANHGRIGIHSALDGRWPDLVGRDAEEAKTHILTERPNLNVNIVPSDMMMTMDYNPNRVRLIVNDERKVVKCPTIG